MGRLVQWINKSILVVELGIVVALQFLVVVMIVVSTGVLFVLGFGALQTEIQHITTIEDLLFRVQRSIAGILIVVLGLEVLETLKAYFRDHQVRLEVILVVAIIAAGRHLVQMDYEHVPPLQILGIAAVVLSLTIGYYLVKKSLYDFPRKTDPPRNNSGLMTATHRDPQDVDVPSTPPAVG
jgi:uncharacterized membrane protein (DUF373 family)